MKVYGISSNSSLKTKAYPKTNKTNNQNVNNTFEFSSNGSNAVKSLALNNISFSKNIKSIKQKFDAEFILKAIMNYSQAQSIYNIIAPNCAKEAKKLQAWVLSDLKSGDEMVEKTRKIENGKIVLSKSKRYSRLGDCYYEATFSNNKLASITTYSQIGEVDFIAKFDTDNGNVLSYQKGSFEDNFDYYIEFNQNANFQGEPSAYFENCSKLLDGTLYYEKAMQFFNSDKITYKTGVNAYKTGEEISVCETFDYKNQNTFTYEGFWSDLTGEKGNIIQVKDFCEI